MYRALPPLAYLQECFALDRGAGILTWRTRFSGREVGSDRVVKLNTITYPTSRIVYILATGKDPGDLQVDHINHDNRDNRPCNLRLATNSKNTQNRAGAQVNSITGIRGVSPKDGGYRARVKFEGRNYDFGIHKTLKDAKDAAEMGRRIFFGKLAGGS